MISRGIYACGGAAFYCLQTILGGVVCGGLHKSLDILGLVLGKSVDMVGRVLDKTLDIVGGVLDKALDMVGRVLDTTLNIVGGVLFTTLDIVGRGLVGPGPKQSRIEGSRPESSNSDSVSDDD
ncbi:hypothetical protein T484DRAFT_1952843 [Baffinella frigidus]|nr:hypothetical protein T484DRAFT_1952843 [Cryptophyta sp. CCMP2293]